MNSEKEVSAVAGEALAQLGAAAIVTREDRAAISVTVRGAKDLVRQARAYFEPMKKAAHAAWKAVVAKENEIVDPLEAGIKSAERRMAEFDRVEREREQAELRRRQDEARRRDEEVRLRVAMDLEAQAAAAREKAASGDLSAAVDALDAQSEADRVLEMPLPESVIVAAPVAKIEGEISRKTWTAEVVDLSALIKAAAEDPRLERLLTFVPKQLNDLARERQGENPPPGVKFEQKTSYAH